MASVDWSNLPQDILLTIEKILSTDVDTLRLRAVCSSWRSSVRPRLLPSPFPLEVPPFSNYVPLTIHGRYFLSYTTIYRLSPPEFGPHAGDPSDGWLFRVSEVNPNRFLILAPLAPNKPDFPLFAPLFPNFVKFPSVAVPKSLNLLDYRVSEVCKCCNLVFVKSDGSCLIKWPIAKKNIVLWKYPEGCEFVVLLLLSDFRMAYWKFGDKDWTRIYTKGYRVLDVIVTRGKKLYAITLEGVLVSFDSEFNLNVVPFPKLPVQCAEHDSRLVEYKSDLYVFMKISKEPSDPDEDVGKHPFEVPVSWEIFKKCSNWQPVTCLRNDIFLSSDDLCVGFSVEDLRGIKGNCVYMAHTDDACRYGYDRETPYGIYDLDRSQTTSIMKIGEGHALLTQPSPAWLTVQSSSSSS